MTRQIKLSFFIILAALIALTSLSTDIYLPAMPQMAQDLNGDVELTISGFLVGFTIGQLVWGAISDRIGRKIPILIGMVLFIIGSIGCAIATTIEQIVFWRIFQAVGACTAPMLSRAIVRDLFSANQAAQMLSSLTVVVAIAPIVAPLLGGQLLQFSSWHSIFWLLASVGIVLFLAVLTLPETHHKTKRTSGSFYSVFRNYAVLLRNRTFMKYTLCVSFFYVATYAFIVGSPEVYIQYFGVEPQHYGWLFGLNIMGIMLLSFFNRSWVRKYPLDKLLKITTAISVIAGMALAFFAYTRIGGLWSIVSAVFLFFAMTGIIAACATAAALNDVAQIAGSASALLGALQYGSGIISSLLLACFSNGTPSVMASIIAIFVILSAIIVWFKN